MEVFTAIQAGGYRAWVKGVVKTHRRGRIRSSHKLQDRAVLMVSYHGSDQRNCPTQWRKGNFEKGHLLPLLMCFTTQFSCLILLDNEDFTLFFRWSLESFFSDLHPPGGGAASSLGKLAFGGPSMKQKISA